MVHRDEEGDLAGIADRALAFSLDCLLFFACFVFSYPAVFSGDSISYGAHQGLWVFLWASMFLIYQAYFSCEGRRSLGKALLGLRVVNLDHEHLDIGQALLRAISYLPSSMMGLGFAWSLFNPSRQSWHDMAAGSVVIDERVKSKGARVLINAGAVLSLGLFVLGFMWQNGLAMRHYQIKTVRHASHAMTSIDFYQKQYQAKNRRYADNLISLAALSSNPGLFLNSVAGLYDLNNFNIRVEKKGYIITTRARDSRNTPIVYQGS